MFWLPVTIFVWPVFDNVRRDLNISEMQTKYIKYNMRNNWPFVNGY